MNKIARIATTVIALAVVVITTGCASAVTRITSSPSGATISLNGRYIGETPVSAEVKQGVGIGYIYRFSATKDGYRGDTKVCDEKFLGDSVRSVVPPSIHFDLQPIEEKD